MFQKPDSAGKLQYWLVGYLGVEKLCPLLQFQGSFLGGSVNPIFLGTIDELKDEGPSRHNARAPGQDAPTHQRLHHRRLAGALQQQPQPQHQQRVKEIELGRSIDSWYLSANDGNLGQLNGVGADRVEHILQFVNHWNQRLHPRPRPRPRSSSVQFSPVNSKSVGRRLAAGGCCPFLV